MGFWSNLFGGKKEVEQKEVQQEELSSSPIAEHSTQAEEIGICEYCGSNIFSDQITRRIMNKNFHKKCAKKLRKESMRLLAGNE